MKCNICGKEISGWGNNPWPICHPSDILAKCCDQCNDEYVLPARILSMRHTFSKVKNANIGDEIIILYVHEKQNFKEDLFKRGIIESINSSGKLCGTWGNLIINPEVDNFLILE